MYPKDANDHDVICVFHGMVDPTLKKCRDNNAQCHFKLDENNFLLFLFKLFVKHLVH